MNHNVIAFDLDSTLAYWDESYGPLDIGPPLPKMVERLKRYLRQGYPCIIFTARAAQNSPHVIKAIEEWTEKHIGVKLPVTATKWPNIARFYDDKAVGCIPNTGELID